MALVPASPARQVTASTAGARQARALAYATIAWMMVEAGVSVWVALHARSVALLGFGLDSVIELVSGGAVLWRFASPADPTREARAANVVGGSLIALAVFIGADSVATLAWRWEPDATLLGIGMAGASLVLMPLLASAKRRVADRTGSPALAGDARQSDICAWLAAVTLAGLTLRTATGWWWVDPIAACLLVPLVVREGLATRRAHSLTDGCCR